MFPTGKDPILHTANPPLELFSLLESLAASRKGTGGGRWNLAVSDVSRPNFFALSFKPSLVDTCPEDFEPGNDNRCGEVKGPCAAHGQQMAIGVSRRNKLREAGVLKAPTPHAFSSILRNKWCLCAL